jgi:hypothetical protein
VYDANDAKKRRVVPVLGIGLYRKIAARSKCYRPDDRPARFTYGEPTPSSPRGIIDCEVTVYKHSHGEWFPVTAKLKWEERAPLKEGGFRNVDNGKKWPDGNVKYDKVADASIPTSLDPKKPNWHTMGETMLAKCVEAHCIRMGWPEETSGSYVDGEMDAAHTLELTATEILEEDAAAARLARVGAANTLLIQWAEGEAIERVPLGQFADAALAWSSDKSRTGGELIGFRHRNQHALQEFWARQKSDALAVKTTIEKRIEQLAMAHNEAPALFGEHEKRI